MNSIKSKVNLTWNNKTSCYQFSLPARRSCPGVEERCRNPECVCNFCYACNSLWNMPAARKLLEHNYNWAKERKFPRIMAAEFLEAFDKIPKKYAKFFRWFGSGDIMTSELGWAILKIAEERPDTRFRLPTHNKIFWKMYAQDCPDNLIISLSQDNLDEPAQEFGTTVVTKSAPLDHFVCRGGCKTCRVCWDSNIPKIAYPIHGSAVTMARVKKLKKVIDTAH